MHNRGRWLLILGAACLLGGCGMAPAAREPITRSAFLLNTFVTVTIYDSQEEALLEESLNLCREYEKQLSRTIEGSDIYRINHRSPEECRIYVADSTAELIEKGLSFSRMSDGAFDITIEPVSSLWDFTGKDPKVPDEGAIEEAVRKVDYRNVAVEGNEIVLSSPDTGMELGAIAKGYIADRMKEYLTEKGVKSAVINLGGNVLCIGTRTDGTPFRIGLRKPTQETYESEVVLKIEDQSMVTSGVYERHFEQDGVNYHHILNPETGYPYQNGLQSVTIVSENSTDGDGLSTACFSLGLEKGMELADSLEGVYAIFITDDGTLHFSEGAETFLE